MAKRTFLVPCLAAAAVAAQIGLQGLGTGTASATTAAGDRLTVAQADESEVDLMVEPLLDGMPIDSIESAIAWSVEQYFEGVSLSDSQREAVDSATSRYAAAIEATVLEADEAVSEAEAAEVGEAHHDQFLEEVEAALTPGQMAQVRENIAALSEE